MCGIAGVYAYRSTARSVDQDELVRMRDHMASRGPDGSGEWYSADGRVGFGHRRLSIIDLSSRGAQPMQTADGRLVITFNGEIYNYRALRSKLEAKGYAFRSNSDTEVLLHLYAELGHEMLRELRGMFAFGIWDSQEQQLLLARDPYGIKPLYYADDGSTLRFASQVKALMAGRGISKRSRPRRMGWVLPVWQRARALHDIPRSARPSGRIICTHRPARIARADPVLFDCKNLQPSARTAALGYSDGRGQSSGPRSPSGQRASPPRR